MSLVITIYVCPTCGATKEIRDDLSRTGNIEHQSVPEKVPCDWRGCLDYAIKKEKLEENFRLRSK